MQMPGLLHPGPVTFLELASRSAIARFVRLDLWLVADERGVAGGFGSGDFGGRHCTGEGHAGGLSTGTLAFETFETFDLFLLVLTTISRCNRALVVLVSMRSSMS